MEKLASTISMIFFVCLLLFCCAPDETGQQAAKIVNAYNKEINQ